MLAGLCDTLWVLASQCLHNVTVLLGDIWGLREGYMTQDCLS